MIISAEKTVTVAQLKEIETISHVPDDQLQWLIDNSEQIVYEVGQELFKQGQPLNMTLIILEGSMRIYTSQAGNRHVLVTLGAGTITGYLPFSRGIKTIGYSECTQRMLTLHCTAEKMREASHIHYELTEALVHIMTTRVREFTAQQQQNEKMLALGKLSAGMAHELNNPAASIVRNASSLRHQLKSLPVLFKKIAAIKMEMKEAEPINQFIHNILSRPEKKSLSMMERAAREDEMLDWLEDNEIKDFEMAETLADMGFTTDDLDELKQCLSANHIPPVLAWVNNNLLTEKLVNDIEEAARRISELVVSVKNFTHMDRATDKQPTDIHTGIRNTLKMLGYKIKKGNIELVEEYDHSLPKILAVPGELNQVWTNLIDNAFDAMEPNGQGVLRITTRQDGPFLQVCIIDNGPGIPEDLLGRVFDPFFTTKEMGKGTGMGLEVVSRIVRQHNGTVKVRSKPGHTEFEVCLPLNQE